MKALIQRVTRASVSVDGKIISSIGKGLLVFVGIGLDDAPRDCEYLTRKILNLRVFDGEKSFADKSVQDLGLEILFVSQFTLFADCNKGNRPSFSHAMPPDKAKVFYQDFIDQFRLQYPKIKDGVFGANMQVELVNDGPVTILLDSAK